MAASFFITAPVRVRHLRKSQGRIQTVAFRSRIGKKGRIRTKAGREAFISGIKQQQKRKKLREQLTQHDRNNTSNTNNSRDGKKQNTTHKQLF